MHAFAATGAGFLVAVLWFDLMFDVQVRRQTGPALPDEVLASIAAYYRRVTTQARPMGQLVQAVMLMTVASLVVEILRGGGWAGWASLALAASAIGLARARTVRNAVRLGGSAEAPDVRTGLARSIYRDHLYCLAAMVATAALQLATQP